MYERGGVVALTAVPLLRWRIDRDIFDTSGSPLRDSESLPMDAIVTRVRDGGESKREIEEGLENSEEFEICTANMKATRIP